MRRRPQDILAGVLLILVLPLTWKFAHTGFTIMNYWIGEIGFLNLFTRNKANTFFYFHVIVFILFPITAFVGGVLAFLGKIKAATLLSALSMGLLLLGMTLKNLEFLVSGYFGVYGPFKPFINAVTGVQTFPTYVDASFFWMAHLPVLIILFVATILLYSRERESEKPKPAFAFQQPIAAAPQGGQLPFGTKKCPECAELIQADAIKCRFCNYRYS